MYMLLRSQDVWICDDIRNGISRKQRARGVGGGRQPSRITPSSYTSTGHGEYPNSPFPPTHRERQERVCTQASGGKTYRDSPRPAPKVRNGCTHWPFMRSDVVILELHARLGSLGFLWRSGYYLFSV